MEEKSAKLTEMIKAAQDKIQKEENKEEEQILKEEPCKKDMKMLTGALDAKKKLEKKQMK